MLRSIFVQLLGFTAATFFVYAGAADRQQATSPFTFHSTDILQADFYDRAFTAAGPSDLFFRPAAIVSSHHLLAADIIARVFSFPAPDNVILISPNHFSIGRADVIISRRSWQTPFGRLDPDLDLFKSLTDSGLAYADSPPFDREHGVRNLAGFISYRWPRAAFTPLIIRQDADIGEMYETGKKLAELAPANTLLVISADFSHEVSSKSAQINDRNSQKVLESLDQKAVESMIVDSPQAIALLFGYLQSQGKPVFHLLNRRDSSFYVPGSSESVTSYITGYYTLLDKQ